MLSPEVLGKRTSTVLEGRHEEIRRELCSYGEARWLSMDWAKRQGERAGGEWLFTVTNSIGQVVLAVVAATTKLSEVEPAPCGP